MTRRDGAAVAAVLLAGVALAAVAAWMRSRSAPLDEPSRLLPDQGLVVELGGSDLGSRLSGLKRFPLYRGLLDPAGGRALRRALGWSATVPEPWPSVPASGHAILGLYRAGWAIVQPAELRFDGAESFRVEGRWRVLASGPEALAPSGSPTKGAALPRAPSDGIRVAVDLGRWIGGSSRARRGWARFVPERADGVVRVLSGQLVERWTLTCERRCLLDLLDAGAASGADAAGWPALPERPSAIEWLRLDPSRLRGLDPGAPENGAEGILGRLDRLERFLGVPLRAELAQAISGPCVVGVPDVAGDAVPRPIVAVDLAAPDRVRGMLDRIVALGVLSGSIVERSYRGVPIASWSIARGRAAIEPAAAVDGAVLVLGLSRGDVADAIDRLRARTESRELAAFHRELAASGRGSWKAVSASARMAETWEDLLGVAAPSRPPISGRTRSVLRKDGDRWILNGEGASPAFLPELLVPWGRTFARSLRRERAVAER